MSCAIASAGIRHSHRKERELGIMAVEYMRVASPELRVLGPELRLAAWERVPWIGRGCSIAKRLIRGVWIGEEIFLWPDALSYFPSMGCELLICACSRKILSRRNLRARYSALGS